MEIDNETLQMMGALIFGGGAGGASSAVVAKVVASKNEKDLSTALKRVKSAEDKHADLRTHVAENYIAKDEFRRFEDKIDDRFDNMEEKIDNIPSRILDKLNLGKNAN